MKEAGEKILLVLLPFWDPQVPPLGMACLKSYLQQHNYIVKAVDTNVEYEFRSIYDSYFNTLKEIIPVEKRGNLYNIGHEVLKNHIMAHLNYSDEQRYRELVKILIYKTFYTEVEDKWIVELQRLLAEFYARLEAYFLALLAKEKPDVLGLSVFSGTLASSVFAFKLTRERYPHIKTVMGGGIFSDQLADGAPNLEFFVEKAGPYIDKIIIGEGENLFLEFLRGKLPETPKVSRLRDIGGKILDVMSAATPDFSDFDLQFYPHLAHYGGRSCPFQCSFCSETVNWGPYRKKNAGRTVEEMKKLYRLYSHQLFLLTDSLLNPIATDLANEIIKSDVPLYWDGFLRADKPVCDPNNAFLWRKGGFYRAKMGLESGSQHVLDLMGKKITIPQIKEALRSLAFAGIKTTTFWVIGHPGETEEDFRMTLDFIAEMKDYIYEADCNPFYYYLTGQSNSQHWMENHARVLLYPEWAKEMLISQTWRLECEPSREETYSRLNRFIHFCSRLGVPNPYSLHDICEADRRWTRLHKNAVPPLVSLNNMDNCVTETTQVKQLLAAQEINLGNESFDF